MKRRLPWSDSGDSSINRDPKRTTRRPTAGACRPQVVGSSNEGTDTCSHRRLEQLQSVSTTECDYVPLKIVQELGSKVREVISLKDKDMLRCLVDCYNAPLEERNEQGLTPLYNAVYSNWSDGALLLLKHGANVHNAEKRPENLWYSHLPLMHLAVKTGSQELVKELIRRGAIITVRDFYGNPFVSFHGFSSPGALFKCLAISLTEESSRRTDLLQDLLFVIRTAAPLAVKCGRVEAFVKKQPSCHQSKMFQLYAACFCFLNMQKCHDDDDDDDDKDDAAAAAAAAEDDNDYKDDSPALHYWRMSEKCTPCKLHDHTMEEEMDFRSVFADILDVKKHPLPDRVTTDNDKLALYIRALLFVEQHMPEDDLLVMAMKNMHERLLAQDKKVTAFGVLWRFTTIRLLCRREVDHVVVLLRTNLEDKGDLQVLPLSALMDSMKTIENCIFSLYVSCHKSQLCSASSLHGWNFITLRSLIEVLVQTMKYYYSLATPEQLQDFSSHVKEFLRRFPSNTCQDVFYRLQDQCTAAMIKDLVACSAEIWGTVRQVNSPLHLLSDWTGNTPLHCLARYRSPEDLVQEGVLQCFLDHGAHLCTKNYQGETVRSILVERGVYTEGELLPSLQCLAAAAFMRDVRLRQTVQNCQPAAVRNFLLDH